MKHPPLIIVGAGPTGLTMAAFLLRHDIPFRIIESGVHSSVKSKALVVQARTLELFRQLGLDQKAIESSASVAEVSIFSEGHESGSISLTDHNEDWTPFPFAAILPQDRTEQILIDEIVSRGQQIEWNTNLTSIQELEDGIHLELTHTDGSTEKVRTDYLIGADGAHSTVRHHMGTEFLGGSYEQSFMLSDVRIDWEIDNKGLIFLLEKDFFCLAFPFKEQNRYRLITLLPEAMEESDFAFLKEFVEKRVSVPMKISEPLWTSAYRVHHRCVASFRKGNIFLAGDAAHIHSPAGGQGMNTGIQDAHALAWRLALVVKGQADPSLLDTYHIERWRIAEHLVHGTDQGFKVITQNHPIAAWLRMHLLGKVLGALFSIERFQHLLFHFISQTSINYEHHYASYNEVDHPYFKAGRRFPWSHTPLTDGQNIYDLLSYESFHLFLFDMGIDFEAEESAEAINGRTDIISVNHYRLVDEADLFFQFKIDSSFIVLVRPDMHIACVSRDMEMVRSYCSKGLGWTLA